MPRKGLTFPERVALLWFDTRRVLRTARDRFRSRQSLERETKMLEEALHILESPDQELPPMTKLERLRLVRSRKRAANRKPKA